MNSDARVNYPLYRKELLRLVAIDQKEIKAVYKNTTLKSFEYQRRKLIVNCHSRAQIILEILQDIGEPTIVNLGQDGSKAMTTLALHSYLSLMKQVLKAYEKSYEHALASIDLESIPVLTDRVLILETKKQLYGTQWMVDKNDAPYLIEIIDVDNVTIRRAKYGLEPIKKPKNMASPKNPYPLGKGYADKSFMKSMPQRDYNEYSKYSLLFRYIHY